MRKGVALSILVILVACVPLSAGRTLGLGIEVGFPWSGLVSVRYWFTPDIGVEGIIFAWGDQTGFDGSFTGRLLYRVSDTDAVDFYLAAGPTVSVFSFEETKITLSTFSGVGGIEFSFPFAPNLAFNLEFGGMFSPTEKFGTVAGGTGIHFYF